MAAGGFVRLLAVLFISSLLTDGIGMGTGGGGGGGGGKLDDFSVGDVMGTGNLLECKAGGSVL